MAQQPEDPKLGAEPQVDIKPGPQSNPDTGQQRPVASIMPIAEPPSQIELLLKTVETELIPRLFVNHMMDIPATSPLVENSASEPQPGPWSSDEAVSEFADLCIAGDPLIVDERITDLMSQGVTLESIFLFLLEPVARHLGDRWLNDQISFIDVQLGLTRLHQLICECESIGYQAENLTLPNHSILLSCAPHENHTFGLTMVADFFRRYGWRVSNLCGLDTDFILTRLQSTHYSAVGFSLHHYASLDLLKELIEQVRCTAKNRELVIMVGGDYFIRHPEAVSIVGADIFANNGKEAVLKAASACKTRGKLVL